MLDSARLSGALEAGTVLGAYRIVEHLGRGGMGDVYRAHDEALDRSVALKTISPQLASDEEFLARFKAEARAAARMSHPNVVQNYFCGEHGGVSFFAMELVDGTSLGRELARRGTIPWREAARYAVEAARGLEAAHEAGLIHRDVKPDNLLLTKTGVVKVADFGLAKRNAEASQTATGVIVGTPRYMSPEQAQAAPLDHRSDMYSLGATLFHLISGKPVFEGASAVIVCTKHLNEPPPRLEGVPPLLAETVARLLAKKPEQRFATWREVGAALEASARTEDAALAPTTIDPASPPPPARREPASAQARVLAAVADFFVGPVAVAFSGLAVAGVKPGAVHLLALGLALVVALFLGRSVGQRLAEVELVDATGGPAPVAARVAHFFLGQANVFVGTVSLLPWWKPDLDALFGSAGQVWAFGDALISTGLVELAFGVLTGRSMLERAFDVRLVRR